MDEVLSEDVPHDIIGTVQQINFVPEVGLAVSVHGIV